MAAETATTDSAGRLIRVALPEGSRVGRRARRVRRPGRKVTRVKVVVGRGKIDRFEVRP